MPSRILTNFILLPELKLTSIRASTTQQHATYFCDKKQPAQGEYCPKCATPSRSTYDHRRVRVRDTPIRGEGIHLVIRKRRLWCKPCGKPFTEPLAGIKKGKRHTERYLSSLHWACENFVDLKKVRRAYACSSWLVYQAYYRHLERKRIEKLSYPWPKIIGIDEHAFRKKRSTGQTEFATMIVDHVNKRVREVAYGKTTGELRDQLSDIKGRENVKYVTLDLCDPFKNFAREFFPDAKLVADKFHVLRLLSPALLKKRYEIAGSRADLRAKKLLLMSSHRLSYFDRLAIHRFLENYPELHELYQWKERLHGFYRIRGFDRARAALIAITDSMAHSEIKEIKTLRRTLLKWREEILNYFLTGLTNARVEGFNNRAKVVKRMGYGYKSFKNYRLRVLSACA